MTESESVRVPFGPQHPALKEPANFILSMRGEVITGMGVRLGYNHRGMEKATEQRSFLQDLYLLERICGICSHSHTTCYLGAVEEIADSAPPKRAQYIRVLIAELERIHSHLLWLGVAGHEVGFDTLLMYTWRDREVVMDLLAELTGNRVNYGINTIGGVRRDLTDEQKAQVLRAIDILEERTKYYVEIATTELTLEKRLSDVGMLSKENVLRYGVTGPTGRASGVARDLRKDDPYLVYDELEFDVITAESCDVYGRAVVRVLELMQSYRIVRQVMKQLPDGPIVKKVPRKIKAGFAVSRYEAPRGEDIHYVRSKGGENPDRVKVRAPTLVNLQAVPLMVTGGYLADMPITLAAIDPCFSCTDRLIALEPDGGSARDILSWRELRERSIQFYRRQGIDFSDLNQRFAKLGID
jgi:NADH-quinone oxidoreductase subunit D